MSVEVNSSASKFPNKRDLDSSNMEKSQGVTEQPKYPYPKQVFFIVGNEFCERFCFYGNKAILAIYLNSVLLYSENDATTIFHLFVTLSFFFTIFGAIIADCYLGKYRTILYLSIIYLVGNITLSMASNMLLPLNHKLFSLLGLFIITVGTGGVKSCVSSFGGDQFVLPQQELQLATFFSVFYFSINAGSLLSTYLTPELRVLQCFGSESCFPLAFGVPAVLMFVSLVIFVCGKPLYTIKNPEGNIIKDVVRCIGTGIRRRFLSKDEKTHWLDHAESKFNPKLILETKILLEIAYVLSPTIIFWSLFDQQGSRWVFQAVHMDGEIGRFRIKPDQMHIITPFSVLILIPLFDLKIYPFFAKLKIIRSSLDKMFYGGLIAAVAFAVSALVEYKIQDAYPDLPGPGVCHLRIYNNQNCSLVINARDGSQTYSWTIDSMDLLQVKTLRVTGVLRLKYSASFEGSQCPKISPVENEGLTLIEQQAISFITEISGSNLNIARVDDKPDDLTKTTDMRAKLRILYSVEGQSSFLFKSKDRYGGLDGVLYPSIHATSTHHMDPGDYTLIINDTVIMPTLRLKSGGVYSILLKEQREFTGLLYTLTPPNKVHVLWQTPQILIMTTAEVMLSVTGLRFSYSQAPQSMKAVVASLWLATDAIGNLLLVVISPFTKNIAQKIILSAFAVLMALVMIIFRLLSSRYTRVMKEINPDFLE